MTTPIYCTGFEGWPATLSTNGNGLCQSISGTGLSVQSTIVRSGSYALKSINSSNYNYFQAPTSIYSSPTVIVVRFYVHFSSWNSVDNEIFWCAVAAGGNLALKVRSSTHKVYARFTGLADGNEVNLTMSLDTWYRVEAKFDVSANPSKIDVQVAVGDGSATTATQSTYAQAATTFTTHAIGSTNGDTFTVYYDDVETSVTGGDYPIGAGAVESLVPSGAGTSNNPSNYLLDNGAVAVNDSTNPAYVELDELPIGGTTDYIYQSDTAVGDYAEVTFADTSNTTIHGVRAILAYTSASTTANNGQTRIRDAAGQETTVYNGDMSESSVFYKSIQVATPAAGWTQATVNGLLGRIGYSSDANPDPYWQSLILEVAYVAGEAPPASNHQQMILF